MVGRVRAGGWLGSMLVAPRLTRGFVHMADFTPGSFENRGVTGDANAGEDAHTTAGLETLPSDRHFHAWL